MFVIVKYFHPSLIFTGKGLGLNFRVKPTQVGMRANMGLKWNE